MHKTILTTLFVILLSISAMTLSGCSPASPTYAAEGQPTYTPESVYVTANSNIKYPTPFQPLAATATHSGAIFPTATNLGTPSINNNSSSSGGSTNNQTATGWINQPDNQVNILLLGSDQRPYSGGYRTDVFLLATINLDDQTINLTSFPRDLYVTLPGLYNDRINTAMARGGFTLVNEMLAYNFGFEADYYALINFWGFSDVINTLGGIDVNVGQTLTDHRSGYGDYTVYAGNVHMDGETALWYVRSRYTSSDFDRGRRQQEVLFALMMRLISFDLVTKFPELYEQYQNTIDTNLPLSEIKPLLPVADEFLKGEIGQYAIGPAQVSNWITPGGAMVLLPNNTAIRSILLEALNAE